MCGRFAQTYDDSALKEKFRLEDVSERIHPELNLSPGMKVNAVLNNGTKLKLSPMLWGFSEIHGRPLPSLLFNSRIETLTGNSHLGRYLIKHRCIIPVSGFYEWIGKQPYFFKGSEDILCLAGVYVKDGDSLKCSVVTTDSAGAVKNIHHRMPLMIPDGLVSDWMKSESLPERELVIGSEKLATMLKYGSMPQTRPEETLFP